MTYKIAQQIANGNQETLHRLFIDLATKLKDSGMGLVDAKREAKALINCMVNAWNKTQNGIINNKR